MIPGRICLLCDLWHVSVRIWKCVKVGGGMIRSVSLWVFAVLTHACFMTSVLGACKHTAGVCCCLSIWTHLSCGTSHTKYSRSLTVPFYVPDLTLKIRATCISAWRAERQWNLTLHFLCVSELFTHIRHQNQPDLHLTEEQIKSSSPFSVCHLGQWMNEELIVYIKKIWYIMLYCKYIVYYSFIFINYLVYL